jgi:hypothetical protein
LRERYVRELSTSLLFQRRNIDSHWDGPRKFFPAGATPEFTTARIIAGHHDDGPLHANSAQSIKTFLQQTLTYSASLIRRINSQVINMSAAPIMTAKTNADHGSSIRRHTAQSWIARQKLSDAFSVVTFGDLETFDALPQMESRVVITD